MQSPTLWVAEALGGLRVRETTLAFDVVVCNDKMITDRRTDGLMRHWELACAGRFVEISLLILAINLARWGQNLPLLSKC